MSARSITSARSSRNEVGRPSSILASGRLLSPGRRKTFKLGGPSSPGAVSVSLHTLVRCDWIRSAGGDDVERHFRLGPQIRRTDQPAWRSHTGLPARRRELDHRPARKRSHRAGMAGRDRSAHLAGRPRRPRHVHAHRRHAGFEPRARSPAQPARKDHHWGNRELKRDQ